MLCMGYDINKLHAKIRLSSQWMGAGRIFPSILVSSDLAFLAALARIPFAAYSISHLPEAPQGSTSPVEDTGRPTSSALTFPPRVFPISTDSI